MDAESNRGVDTTVYLYALSIAGGILSQKKYVS